MTRISARSGTGEAADLGGPCWVADGCGGALASRTLTTRGPAETVSVEVRRCESCRRLARRPEGTSGGWADAGTDPSVDYLLDWRPEPLPSPWVLVTADKRPVLEPELLAEVSREHSLFGARVMGVEGKARQVMAAEVRESGREVRLRTVEDQDIDVFFDHQADPEASEMAAFPARDKDQFAGHWAKIRADGTAVQRTIVADGAVAGYIGSWEQDGQRLVGYWIGREHWGRGVATGALAQFAGQVTARPLHAHVAVHNIGSIRVLEKCGFRRDRVQEAKAPAPDDGVEEFIFVLGE